MKTLFKYLPLSLLLAALTAQGATVTLTEKNMAAFTVNSATDPTNYLVSVLGVVGATNARLIQVSDVLKLATNEVSRLGAIVTNLTGVVVKQTNYVLKASDVFVLAIGNKTVTAPPPATSSGKLFTVQCASAGTNAILANSGETFNNADVQGATKWTNSAIGHSTQMYSDGTNWWITSTQN